MLELGHQVLIACQPDSQILEKARELNIPAIPLRIRAAVDPIALVELVNIIRKQRIDVVNTHSGKDTWIGGFAARIGGAGLFVRTRHLMVPISASPANFINRMADGVITTGEYVRETMIRDNRISPERIISIPTGVSLERFTPGISAEPLRRELGIDADAPVISMVAVLRGAKRHDVFLGAAALLQKRFPRARFLIVGGGPMGPDLTKQIQKLNLSDNVILTGHRSDIPEVMALSDVVVLTSEKEGVPQTLTQAMAMERPVVAARIGGIPDLINDGVTGLFAETASSESFAEKVGGLLEDPALRARIAAAGRRHVLEHFTDISMVQRTVDFYRSLENLRQASHG
jgi:glycosyltransferase involved in cell wall biosynthesis